jgi:hypothetical protein
MRISVIGHDRESFAQMLDRLAMAPCGLECNAESV